MDNFNYVFGYMMERAMTMVAYCTLAAVVEKTLKAEREKVRAALGHVRPQENWQDYYNLQQERLLAGGPFACLFSPVAGYNSPASSPGSDHGPVLL